MVNDAAKVDSRLVQANERTLLAWIRTAIALLTFGFVIARIGIWLRFAGGGHEPAGHGTAWIGAVFCAVDAVANGMALVRYHRAKRHILRGEALPGDRFPLVFGVVVTILGALLGAYVLSRLV
jgi:putative membrane protein